MKQREKIGLWTGLAALSATGLALWWVKSHKNSMEKPVVVDQEDAKHPLENSYNTLDAQRIKMALTPISQRNTVTHFQDLKKYGTAEGVIDVANELGTKQKKKKLYSEMGKTGKNLVEKVRPQIIRKEHQKNPKTYQAFYKWLIQAFNKLQITITNTSSGERTIRLWGMNQGVSVSPPKPDDVEDHEIIATIEVPLSLGVGIHPQGMAVNPVNGLTYVANQLSDNVIVIDRAGQVVTIIQLQPHPLPGSNSPIAVAVNTHPSNPNYGKVYVVGSVSNTISVIDLNYQVTNTISVGVRPVAIAFNPVNDQLYVANLVSNDVSVIDSLTETITATIPVGQDPLGIGINPVNGDVYVVNSTSNTVSVFDSSNVLVTTLIAVGTQPVSATYHPLNQQMYVVATGSNEVYPINATNYVVLSSIPTGNKPYQGMYNTNNQFLYVGNRDDETMTVIAPDQSIRATISKGDINIGMVINQNDNQLFISDTGANTVNLIGYAPQSSSIQINEDYAEKAENFLHNPALVKHTKWVMSGSERFKVLNFVEETPSGLKKQIPLSHENYKSPQNYLNVSELMDLEGTIIDGKTSWVFKVAGFQTITLMVYFLQLETEYFVPGMGEKLGLDKNIPHQGLNQIFKTRDQSLLSLKT